MKLWSRPVEDKLGLMTRTELELPAAAADIFQLMTSKTGFAIINPGCTNHGAPPIETLEWSGSGRGGSRVECVLAVAPSIVFPLSDREFVVCNMFDMEPEQPPAAAGAGGEQTGQTQTRLPLFVSKSIKHPKHPRWGGAD